MGVSEARLSTISISREGPLPAISEPLESGSGLVSELTSYLGELGLGANQLEKVVSLLQAGHEDGAPQTMKAEAEIEPAMNGRTPLATGKPSQIGSIIEEKAVGLFLAEEQPILMQAYRSFFGSQPAVELLGCSKDISGDALVEAASIHQPDVLLLGVKALRPSTIEMLETLRDAFPRLGVVLLFAFYDTQGIKALREFSRDVNVGRAYLLKHTIYTVDQLTQAICSVAEGRMIVDPTIMEELIKTGDAQNEMLRDLSPRALEVLHWVARGYRNETIAGVLSRDVKTVERHINNIYTSLLGPDDNAKHPRVRAALMYLRATGVLSTEQLMED